MVNDIGSTEGEMVGQEDVQEGEELRDAEREDEKQDAVPVIHDGDVG